MVKHTRKIVLAIAALAALALGGATLAQAGNPPSKAAQIKHAKVHPKAHAKAAQAGESETPGTEAPDAPDAAGEAAGSEVPNDDGAGGHADEPGNPTADHQFQGEE
jgi:hypothetical protein